MRKVAIFPVLFSVFALSGCVLNVLEYTTPENANKIFDNYATIPTPEKSFTGFVQVGDNIPIEQVTEWMKKRCGEIRGGGYVVGSRWKGTAGPHSTPNYYKCVPAPQAQVANNLPSVNQSLGQIQPPASSADKNSFSDAKNKCAQIGFAEGTEGFGRCVLQLSK